ncbi:hypothetical protein PMAYCL1PPCAC_03633, partial [Pristionchus mayeri]
RFEAEGERREEKMAVSRAVQRGCFCVLVCSLIYLVVLIASSSRVSTVRSLRLADDVPVRPPRKPVLIYTATKFFKMDVSNERFLSVCTSSKDWCTLSDDKRDLRRADAVLFHNADFDMNYRGPAYKKRNPDIPYVLWSLESPANDVFRPRNNFINWTMTYRRDADIWYPYGRMERRTKQIIVDYDKIWRNKNESLPPATWLASNCYAANGRSVIINRLADVGLKVDKWGKCGRPPPKCDGVQLQGDQCVIDLIKPYKFYLAFENSNCRDYVTEKFYETLRSRQAVPIVLHRKTYEDLGIPSSSFVALSDYASIAEAVRDIKRIAGDKNAYLEYHKWREQYEVIPEHNDGTGFCLLCRKLAERSQMPARERISSRKSYPSVQDWHSDEMCDNSFTFH